MKKLLIFSVFTIMSTVSLVAQDIIVTNNAQKIEAKILEVSKTEIRYKEADNLDGPTFVMETQEINSIIYSNGKVALYNQEKVKEESQKSAQKDEKDAELKDRIDVSEKQYEAKHKAIQEQIVREEIQQNVIVDFEIERTNNPFMYRFPNLSSGASDFRWDFGDGTFSLAKEAAMKTYERPGTYTVTLTANVGGRQYLQRKTLEVGTGSQQKQMDDPLDKQLIESGAQLGQAIKTLVEVKNSYALDVRNTTKYPYRINLDGHILGVVNPYKTERFIVSVAVYGRMQAVQTSGYVFSPTIKEYRIPQQQKQTAYSVVIK